MLRKYESPTVTMVELKNENVITKSGLIFGGDNGQSKKESFSSLFGNG